MPDRIAEAGFRLKIFYDLLGFEIDCRCLAQFLENLPTA